MSPTQFRAHLASAKLFVDTSSLMRDDSASVFLDFIKPALIDTAARLIVPMRVIQELERHVKRAASPESAIAEAAKAGLRILEDLDANHLLDKREEAQEPFTDGLLLQVFVRFRQRYPLSLITQDVALTTEILALRESKAVQGIKAITVFTIARGELRVVDPETASRRLARQEARRKAND